MKNRVEVNLNLALKSHKYWGNFNNDENLDIRINFFFRDYFSFYSGLFWRKRAIKRATWVYELLYHRDKIDINNREVQLKPLKLLKGVERGDYKYKKTTISLYLMRRLISISDHPTLDPYAS